MPHWVFIPEGLTRDDPGAGDMVRILAHEPIGVPGQTRLFASMSDAIDAGIRWLGGAPLDGRATYCN